MNDKTSKKKQGVFLKNIMAAVGFGGPIAATAWLVIALVTKIDHLVIGALVNGVVTGGLPDIANPGTYAPVLYQFPGVGLVVMVAVLFFGGMLIRTWLGNKIKTLVHYVMEQVPFVGGAFKMIKKVIDQVTSQEENAPEKKPVMVEYTRDGVFFPAFSLGISTMFKCPETGERLEVIYVPTSPNPTSGFVILLLQKLVHATEYGSDAQMEFILSCGFSQSNVSSVLSGAMKAELLPTGEIMTTAGVLEVMTHEENDGTCNTLDVSLTLDEPAVSGDYTPKLDKMQK